MTANLSLEWFTHQSRHPEFLSGISDCIAWAKGMDHLLRNGHRFVVDLSNQTLPNTSTVAVIAAAVSKPEINKELCKPAEFRYAVDCISFSVQF
ncbi:hypothetical protein [Pseudomonas syringae]|uniref:hypothetical protein n=1 Tax=Pseudomonas syringae TaxID=317 RepID=UPI003F74BCAB